MYKCIYFGLKELVSPVVYNKWGEQAWMFFGEDELLDLDTIRETWGSSIIINNWGSGLKQCGLRSNLDEIPYGHTKKNELYLSGHTMGKAFDLHAGNGLNNKLWAHCYNLIAHKKLRAFRRLEEKTNGWVHIDSLRGNHYTF